MRSVPEWVGKNDDSTIPQSVRLRVFAKYGGRCGKTDRKLGAGEYDIDHIIALRDWIATPEQPHGNRESNLMPLWRVKHREKTSDENKSRAKVNRTQDKHFRPKQKGKIPSRPFAQRHSNVKQLETL